MTDRAFGISTHLFHDTRLSRDHLVDVAAHGFEAIELYATRAHFNYRDERCVEELAEWLSDTRLELHSLHAPPGEGSGPGIQFVLDVARRIPYRYLVVHPVMPSAEKAIPAMVALAADVNVRVALEVMALPAIDVAALVSLIEDTLEDVDVGICVDYGHAHLMGDLGEAIETASGHMLATHLHDNGGRHDDHLVPFAGSIDWDMAMMTTQKIGYDGVLMFELASSTDPVGVLKRAVKARERLEKTFISFDV